MGASMVSHLLTITAMALETGVRSIHVPHSEVIKQFDMLGIGLSVCDGLAERGAS